MSPEREEACVAALAEVFRGDGEILASPMGDVPAKAARLARSSFAPDLLMSNGVASLVDAEGNSEGPMNYRRVFDVVWSGRRHVVMGTAQIDAFGNTNISAIGDWAQPKVQLLGVRGAPGNTVNHVTSYWVPNHSKRVFVPKVDVVSGVGTNNGAAEIRGVVSNLGVFDFRTPDGRMRLVRAHEGVTVAEIVEATGFELVLPEGI